MPQSQDPKSIFAEYLTRNRLKMTSQRDTILDVFLESPGHPTSEELYALVREEDISIGQATVYRTMKLLTEAGLAREVHFGDGVTRYEVTHGAEHHDHLICERCGRTLEVVDPEIERLQEKLAKEHGWVLTGHRLCLYGNCPQCKNL